MFENSIGEFFDFVSEKNLIEEYFYEHAGAYPVYSGQTENNGIVAYIDSFEEDKPCLTLTTYGSAGKLSYRQDKCTIGRNCMGLRVKKKYEKEINMEWFSYKFQNLFYRLTIGDPKGQKSLNKLILENVKVAISDYSIQLRELQKYKEIEAIKKMIEKIIIEINNLGDTVQGVDVPKYSDIIKEFFSIKGGNSGLTEDFIYYNQPINNEDGIKIVSGSAKMQNIFGEISNLAKPAGKNLKIYTAPLIQIVRKGLAGKMIYINEGKFVANDDVYVLIVKEKWKDKINLQWFAHEYQPLFYDLTTSKSDNATFNKEYMLNQKIKIPDYVEQKNISTKLTELTELKLSLEKIRVQCIHLIEYKIT